MRSVRRFSVLLLLPALVALLSLRVDGAPSPAAGNEPASDSRPEYLIPLAHYVARVVESRVEVELTVTVRSLSRERRQVPLLPAGMALKKATVSARGASLGRDATGRIVLFLPGRKTCRIVAEFVTRLEHDGGESSFLLPLVSATSLEVRAELPGESRSIATSPACAFSVATTGDRKVVTLFPTSREMLGVRWSHGEARAEPVIVADQSTSVIAERGLLRRHDVVALELPRGAVMGVRLAVPAGLRIRRIVGPDVAAWETADLDGRPSAVVRLKTKVEQRLSFTIESERLLDMPAHFDLAPFEVIGAAKQRGRLEIYPGRHVTVHVAKTTGTAQVDALRAAAEDTLLLPAVFSADARRRKALGEGRVVPLRPKVAYEYGALPAVVSLVVSEVLPRLSATVDTVSRIEAGVITAESRIRFEVADAGVGRLDVRMDPGAEVFEVEGGELASWRTEGGIVTLSLARRSPGVKEFRIVSQQELKRVDGIRMPLVVPLGAERFVGRMAVAAGEVVELMSGRVAGARQVTVASLPAWMQRSGAKIAYRFERSDASIAVRSRKLTPELSVELAHVVIVRDRSIEEHARAWLKVASARLFDVDIRVPGGLLVSRAEGGGVKEWSLRDDGRMLHLHFPEGILGEGGSPVSIVGERLLREGAPLGFAGYEFANAVGVHQFVAVVIDTNLALKELDRAGLRPIAPADIATRLPVPGQVDLAYAGEDGSWSLRFQPSRVEAAVNVRTGTLLSARTGLVSARTRIQYNIKKAGLNRLRIRLPAGALNSEVSGEGIVSRQLEGDTWVIALGRKLRGTRQIDLAYNYVLPDGGGSISVSPPKVLGAAAQTGYLVLGRGRHDAEVSVGESDGLWPAQIAEVPKELITAGGGALDVRRYADPAASLALEVTSHKLASVLQAKVLKSELQTLIKTGGDAIYQLDCLVANSGKQHLAVTLPDGGVLWGAYVGGQPAKVSVSKAGEVVVPILRKTDEPVLQVRLIWEQASPELGLTNRLELSTPDFDVSAQELRWHVLVPESYRLKLKDGNMKLLGQTGARPIGRGRLFGPEQAAVRPVWRAIRQALAAAWRWLMRVLALLWRHIATIVQVLSGAVIALACAWGVRRVWLRHDLRRDWPNALCYASVALLGLDFIVFSLRHSLRLPFDDWPVWIGVAAAAGLMVALVGWLCTKGPLARWGLHWAVKYALGGIAAFMILVIVGGLFLPMLNVGRMRARSKVKARRSRTHGPADSYANKRAETSQQPRPTKDGDHLWRAGDAIGKKREERPMKFGALEKRGAADKAAAAPATGLGELRSGRKERAAEGSADRKKDFLVSEDQLDVPQRKPRPARPRATPRALAAVKEYEPAVFARIAQGKAKGALPIRVAIPETDLVRYEFGSDFIGEGVGEIDVLVVRAGAGLTYGAILLACLLVVILLVGLRKRSWGLTIAVATLALSAVLALVLEGAYRQMFLFALFGAVVGGVGLLLRGKREEGAAQPVV